MGIEVRKDITTTVLRKKARTEKSGRVVARMLGMANILEGMERGAAARAVGLDRQTLCDGVDRYNAAGLEGLRNRAQGRPKRCLNAAQDAEIAQMVSHAPPEPLVCWRCVDIKAEIEKRFGVVVHESTVGTLLHRLGFRHLSARPIPPKNDPDVLAAFKKT